MGDRFSGEPSRYHRPILAAQGSNSGFQLLTANYEILRCNFNHGGRFRWPQPALSDNSLSLQSTFIFGPNFLADIMASVQCRLRKPNVSRVLKVSRSF